MTSLRLSIAYRKLFYPSNSRYQSIRDYAIEVGESSPISAKNLHKKLSEYRITIKGRVIGCIMDYSVPEQDRKVGLHDLNLKLVVNSHVIGEENKNYVLIDTYTDSNGYYSISFNPCPYKNIISRGLLKYNETPKGEHRNLLDLYLCADVSYYVIEDYPINDKEWVPLFNHNPNIIGKEFVYREEDIEVLIYPRFD